METSKQWGHNVLCLSKLVAGDMVVVEILSLLPACMQLVEALFSFLCLFPLQLVIDNVSCTLGRHQRRFRWKVLYHNTWCQGSDKSTSQDDKCGQIREGNFRSNKM